jgi:cholesterol oxidase
VSTLPEGHFDTIVIGSGFGGSVVAYRLAESGRKVCLLERGQRYAPGTFPRDPEGMKRNFWDPSEGYYGLYDLWATSDLAGVTASGLGGGSLIYANVMLRKDERSFLNEHDSPGGYDYWPVTRENLEAHYDHVEQIISPQPYPILLKPYSESGRAQALRAAANAHRLRWSTPKLAVTFSSGRATAPGIPIHEKKSNLHGVPRQTCRLCSECCFGCNFGSKNSLDLNYLSLAQRSGAELHTLCEARLVHPMVGGDGYVVRYVQHDLSRCGRPLRTHDHNVLPVRSVTAKQVVLCCGTYGTTYLLMRSRKHLQNLSSCLGTKFCTNGDFLAVGTRCRPRELDMRLPGVIGADFGTAITGAIELPAAPGTSFPEGYIEDLGYPSFVAWLLQVADVSNLWSVLHHVLPRLMTQCPGRNAGRDSDSLNGDVATLFGSTGLSAGTMPLIGVGRDMPNGVITMMDDRLDVTWSEEESSKYFGRARAVAKSVTSVLRGRYWDGRIGRFGYGVTMHPLGGCPMGKDPTQGVVNSFGEVYNNPGLFVADGSVLPGPIGVNPAFTIAALADRTAEHILRTVV